MAIFERKSAKNGHECPKFPIFCTDPTLACLKSVQLRRMGLLLKIKDLRVDL